MIIKLMKFSALILLVLLLVVGCFPSKGNTVESKVEDQPVEKVVEVAKTVEEASANTVGSSVVTEQKPEEINSSTSKATVTPIVSQALKTKSNEPVYTREIFKTPDGRYTIERPLLLSPVGDIKLPLRQSLSVRWEGTAKGYYINLTRLGNGYDRPSETIIDAYLGDVRSYTLPAFKFLGGAEYSFALFATPPLGVERMYPHWSTIRPVNLPGTQAIIKVDNDILRAPEISYPDKNAELPLADLTLKWQFEWNDIRPGRPYMELEIEDSEGQLVIRESWVENEGKQYSYTIPKSRLVSGKDYNIRLMLGFDGVTQTTRSSFKIKGP